MKKLGITLLRAVAVLAVAVRSATAIPNFQKQFVASYVDADANPEYAEAVKTAKCNVCHKGKSKKDRNAYGEELSKLLDKKADKNEVEKIKAALEQVGGMKSDPDDASSKTYGDLIKAGKLPAEG